MEFGHYSYIDILIGIVLALIMFGIGLSMSVRDIRFTLLRPKSLILGLFIQMILTPLLIFIILYFFDMPFALKIGCIILSTCPGGTTSSFVVYLFRCNTALSVAITSINSILALFSIPFIVNYAIYFYTSHSSNIHLPVLPSILQILLITILPAAAGMYVRAKHADLAVRIQKPIKYVMLVLLGTVFSIKFFLGEELGGTGITFDDIRIILVPLLIFHVTSYIFAYVISFFFKRSHVDSVTIAAEVSLHNTTLAFLVAGTLLQNQDMVKPSLIYSLFSFGLTIVFTYIAVKIKKVRRY